jgi:hypothetical protein
MGRGLGFGLVGEIDGQGRVGLVQDTGWRKKRGLMCGARLSAAGSIPLRVLAS